MRQFWLAVMAISFRLFVVNDCLALKFDLNQHAFAIKLAGKPIRAHDKASKSVGSK